ncbi:hypothetical protein ACWEFL_19635 [Streptomyces sp. NPDC004838]
MKKMFRTAAVTAAALGLTVASFTSAGAAPWPAFLSASQLPAAPTPWTAGPAQAGLPEDFCTAGTAARAASKHRLFWTELDTNARQTITVAPSEAKAKALVTKVRASIESCLGRLQQQNPTLQGEAVYEGPVNIEEGAHVYSIDTWDPEVGSDDVSLYSVGRDGRTVTVIGWGQLGDMGGAPLAGFRATTKTAVAKLH